MENAEIGDTTDHIFDFNEITGTNSCIKRNMIPAIAFPTKWWN